MQKNKDINCFFPALLLIKESFNLTGGETTGYTQPKSGSLRFYLPLKTISMKKKIT